MLIRPIVSAAVQGVLPSGPQLAVGVATKCVSLGLASLMCSGVGFHLDAHCKTTKLNDFFPLLNIRGGQDKVDLERVNLRLGSLEEYCVIASIILGAVIDIYGDTPRDKSASKVERVAQSLHGICICIGFLAAVYTTVVFSLFGLYAKTALGTGDDQGYLKLLEETGTIRFRGFQSFLICLSSFNVSFLLNMFLNHQGKTRWIISVISLVGTTISLKHFQFIVNTASQIIFK